MQELKNLERNILVREKHPKEEERNGKNGNPFPRNLPRALTLH